MSDPFGPPGGHTPRGDPVPFTTFTVLSGGIPGALATPPAPPAPRAPVETSTRVADPAPIRPRRPAASNGRRTGPPAAPPRAPARWARAVAVLVAVLLLVLAVGGAGYLVTYRDAADNRADWMRQELPFLGSAVWTCDVPAVTGRPWVSEVSVRCERGDVEVRSLHSDDPYAGHAYQRDLRGSGVVAFEERPWNASTIATRLVQPPAETSAGTSRARVVYLFQSGFIIDVTGPTLADIRRVADRWLPRYPGWPTE